MEGDNKFNLKTVKCTFGCTFLISRLLDGHRFRLILLSFSEQFQGYTNHRYLESNADSVGNRVKWSCLTALSNIFDKPVYCTGLFKT